MKLSSIFQNAWKQINKTQNFDVNIFYSSLNNEYHREELKHSSELIIFKEESFFEFFVGITGSWKALEDEC